MVEQVKLTTAELTFHVGISLGTASSTSDPAPHVPEKATEGGPSAWMLTPTQETQAKTPAFWLRPGPC